MPSKLFKYFGSSTILLLPHVTHLAMALADSDHNCHMETCHPIEQYCSQFDQNCRNCSDTCDPQNVQYESSVCNQQCSDFIKLQPLKAEIHQIQTQQNIILILLILLLIFTAGHFTWKLFQWLRHKRCLRQLMKKLKLKKGPALPTTIANGKDLGGITIQNVCAINDIERPPSQTHSLTGVEGSIRTVTTPLSTRYPAENTAPPPTLSSPDYSYDNQGLVVTPGTEKPNSGPGFP